MRRSATSSRKDSCKGLSVSVSGTNLTDEPFVLNNVDDPTYNLIKHQEYGAVYSLAVTYKF